MVDDGAIGSESLEQHRLDVAENLTKMAEKHHTIKPKKMRILPEEVKYLGHIVTRDGTREDPECSGLTGLITPAGISGQAPPRNTTFVCINSQL